MAHLIEHGPNVLVVASPSGPKGFDLALIAALQERANVEIINYASPFVARDNTHVVVNRAITEGNQHITDLKYFEQQTGIRVTNPLDAAARSRDKRTYPTDYSGLVVETEICSNLEEILDCAHRFGRDVVVKGPEGYQSNELAKYTGETDIAEVQKVLGNITKQVVVQPFIPQFVSTQIRVVACRDSCGEHHVLGAYRRVPAPGDWKTGPVWEGMYVEHSITEAERALGIEVAKRSNLDFIGMDLGYLDNKPTLIETNSSPGGIGLQRHIPQASERYAELVVHLATVTHSGS